MKIEGAIFDLDGTLLDSMIIWDTVGEDYLLSLGIRPREDLREALKPMSLLQAAEYFKAAYGVEKTTEEIMDGINSIVEQFYISETVLKDGVADFLQKLARRKVKMCIATATDQYLVEAALKRCGILQYFTGIFTCSEVGHGKDEPVIYEKALEHLGTEKGSTLVFEDAVHAIETAKRAGFVVAGVFDKSEKQEKVRALSDFYITDFREVEE